MQSVSAHTANFHGYEGIEDVARFGPVSWTDTNASHGSLEGAALEEAVTPLRDRGSNPDGAFVRAILEHRGATPDLHTAVHAHRLVDAMYASAAAGGEAVHL